MLAANGTGTAPNGTYLYEANTKRVFFQRGFDGAAGKWGVVTGATVEVNDPGGPWFKVEYQLEPRDYIRSFDCTRTRK